MAVTPLRPGVQSVNISHLNQKRRLFTIDYVCKIPWGGGGGESRTFFSQKSNCSYLSKFIIAHMNHVILILTTLCHSGPDKLLAGLSRYVESGWTEYNFFGRCAESIPVPLRL